MSQKDRKTLKSYFEKGDVPTEAQFADLIDSVTNFAEDGMEREDGGWAFYPTSDNPLRFALRETPTGNAVWTLELTSEKSLTITNEQGATVMELDQDKSVTFYGAVKQDGDKPEPSPQPEPSGEGYITLPADKQWHDLPVDLTREGFGCRVFNIYAAFRDPDLGLNKLTLATAIWQDFATNKIASPQKHWWGWSGGVKIRWQASDKKLHLQMRSKRASEKGKIHCRIEEVFKG